MNSTVEFLNKSWVLSIFNNICYFIRVFILNIQKNLKFEKKKQNMVFLYNLRKKRVQSTILLKLFYRILYYQNFWQLWICDDNIPVKIIKISVNRVMKPTLNAKNSYNFGNCLILIRPEKGRENDKFLVRNNIAKV